MLLSLFTLPLASCDKDEPDDKPTEPVELKKVSEIESIILGNQYIANATGCFLNVQEQKVIKANDNEDFDIAFAYRDEDEKVLYIFAGPTATPLKNEMKLKDITYNCDNETVFYRLPKYFKSAHFDTLATVDGLNALLKESKKVYNADGSSDCIYSEGYGWLVDDMFGFKLSSGKFGIFRIDDIPNTTYEKMVEANSVKNVRLSLKYEGE